MVKSEKVAFITWNYESKKPSCENKKAKIQ